MNIETTIEIEGEDVLLDVECTYYRADPSVGYMEPWIELESAVDCEGNDILRTLDKGQKAQIINSAWDEISDIMNDKRINARV